MSAHAAWRKAKMSWRKGETGDHTVLKAASLYLQASADWISVRDFLITMAMSNEEILSWFADEDFPDFQEAVDDGWGWPEPADDQVLCET